MHITYMLVSKILLLSKPLARHVLPASQGFFAPEEEEEEEALPYSASPRVVNKQNTLTSSPMRHATQHRGTADLLARLDILCRSGGMSVW